MPRDADIRNNKAVSPAEGRFPVATALDPTDTMTDDAPPFDCQSCGACCAYAADWPRFTLEDDADIARIPEAMVAENGSGMRWTGDRCAALAGEVGRHVACGIYADRPIVCHDCVAGDEACLMARERHGLPLLPDIKPS